MKRTHISPNFTVISRGEIITGMRQAKNAKAQKKIFAELCNCTVANIEQILKEEEQMNRWTEKDIAVLDELLKEGKSRTEIAEHFGRDEKSVENKIYDLRRKGIIQYPPKDKYTIQKPKKDPTKAAHTPPYFSTYPAGFAKSSKRKRHRILPSALRGVGKRTCC